MMASPALQRDPALTPTFTHGARATTTPEKPSGLVASPLTAATRSPAIGAASTTYEGGVALAHVLAAQQSAAARPTTEQLEVLAGTGTNGGLRLASGLETNQVYHAFCRPFQAVPVMTRVGAYGTAAVLLFAALASASSASAQSSGSSWVLEQGQGVATIKGSSVSLTLDDKQMSGSTGCNAFRATIADRPDKRVAIGDVTLTRKLCAPEASNNERAIVQAFGRTEFVEQGPGTLTFLSAEREPLLVWRTAEKAAVRDGSLRAAMVPPLAAKLGPPPSAPREQKKRRRNRRHACATKASCKRVAHGHARHSHIAQRPRRCLRPLTCTSSSSISVPVHVAVARRRVGCA